MGGLGVESGDDKREEDETEDNETEDDTEEEEKSDVKHLQISQDGTV